MAHASRRFEGAKESPEGWRPIERGGRGHGKEVRNRTPGFSPVTIYGQDGHATTTGHGHLARAGAWLGWPYHEGARRQEMQKDTKIEGTNSKICWK